MAPGHAVSGILAGLAAVNTAGALGVPVSPATAVLGTAVCAGAALLPDLDTPRSTVSSSLGPVTRALSKATGELSSAVYRLTATTRDGRDEEGSHRRLTHTVPWATLLGVLAWLAAQHTWGVIGVLFLCLSLALRGLVGGWLREMGRDTAWWSTTLAAAALTGAAWLWVPTADMPPWLLGAIVGFGAFVHCLGDTLTKMGAPWLWPLTLFGKRWYDIAPPATLRFRTGGGVENGLVIPLMLAGSVVLGVGAAPGGWDLLGWCWRSMVAALS